MKCYVVTYSYVNKNNSLSRGQKVVEATDAETALKAATPVLNSNHKYWTLSNVKEFGA